MELRSLGKVWDVQHAEPKAVGFPLWIALLRAEKTGALQWMPPEACSKQLLKNA